MMIAALDGEKVLQETGLTYADDGTGIDSSVTCSQDMRDGKIISSMNVMSYVGGHLGTEGKVAEDSINAVYCGSIES